MPTTTALTLTTYSNYNTVGLKLTYVEDTWETSTVAVTGRVQVGGVWHDTHDLVKDPTTALTYWGKVFGLEEGIGYPLEITWTRTADDDDEVLETVVTTATATTRTSPESSDTSLVYISPSGNDTTGTGAYHLPYKTWVKAASVLGSGGTIIMKNGVYARPTYSFGDAGFSSWGINDVDGAADAYKTIRAETQGAVTISGKLLLTGLTWTQHASNIWYAPFTNAADHIDTDPATDCGPQIMRNEVTGNYLYLYRYFTSGSAVGEDPAMEDETLDIEGFIIDWTNERIYIRQKAARVGSAPASNEYSASFYDYGPDIINSRYWIVDGIEFEMFGKVVRSGGSQFTSAASPSRVGLGIGGDLSGDTHIVIRNCTFDAANIGNENSAVSFLTIEDCTFNQQNMYDALYSNPLTAARYARLEDSANPNNRHDILLSGGCAQTVVRRCTSSGGYWFVNAKAESQDGGDHSDFYDNTLTDYAAWAFRMDSDNGTLGNQRSSAIFHNTFDSGYGFLDASTLETGPMWVIGNYVVNFFHGPWRKDVDPCDGWFLVYNNTFWTQVVNQADTLFAYMGAGASSPSVENRTVVKNNIFAGTGDTYYRTESSAAQTAPGIVWHYNAFYTPDSTPEWNFHDVGYATEALMLAHTASHDGDYVSFVGNVYGTNPYPNGISGALHPDLLTYATDIAGITTLAADAIGVPNYGIKKPVGYFPKFAYPLIRQEDRQVVSPSNRRRSFTESNTS